MNALHLQVGGPLSISHLLYSRQQSKQYQNTLKFWVSCDRTYTVRKNALGTSLTRTVIRTHNHKVSCKHCHK